MDKIYLHIFSIFTERKTKSEPGHTYQEGKQSLKAIKAIVLCIVKYCNKSHSQSSDQ